MKLNYILPMLLAAATAVCAAPPDRPEKLQFKPLDFQIPRASEFKTQLRNGIPVYLNADPKGVPLVHLDVRIRGGAYLEPQGKEGLCTLLGTQWRDGGTEKTTAANLDERLEFLAAGLGTQVGGVTSSVGLDILRKDLDEGLDLFMQVLTRPAFAEDRLHLNRQEALQGLQGRNDDATAIGEYTNRILLNGEGHFTARQPTLASISSISRDDLKAMHARLIHPKNMVVVVTGSFDRKAMLEKLNSTLGALQAGPGAQVSGTVPPPGQERQPGIYMVDKPGTQSTVLFTLPGLRRMDPDWHACRVLNEILGGGGFSSRLTKRLRSDEGLTYGISTGFDEGTYWKGDWAGSFSTKNRSVAFALSLVREEMERITREPVPEAELSAAKDGLVQAFPAQWSDRMRVLDFLANQRLAQWPEDLHVDFRERIKAVTAADVLRVAKKYLAFDRLVTVIVGPVAEIQAGDPVEHPIAMKDLGPIHAVPMRDPMTFAPLS